MKYISINLGMMPTNSYILFDEKTLNCAIIDPADDFEKINRYLQRYSLNLKYILLSNWNKESKMNLRKWRNQ